MTTNTITKPKLQELTLNALDVLDLFAGTSLMAHQKEDLLALNCVALSAAGGLVKAVSTDRFKLLIGEITLDDTNLILDQIQIPLESVKRIIATLKALPKRMVKIPTITFTRAGDVLSVTVAALENSSTITITLGARGERDFPAYDHLFPADKVAVDGIAFNPNFMALYGKVPTSNSSGTILNFTFHGENKPATIKIPHDRITWRGLIMPMRTIK